MEKEEGEETEEEVGSPPPGWQSLNSPPTPVFEKKERHRVQLVNTEDIEDEEDGPPPGWQSIRLQTEQAQSHSDQMDMPQVEITAKEQKVEDEEEEDGPPPGWHSIPPHPPPVSSESPAQPSPAEMAQMVCGSCQRLLSYPRGAKYVKCQCCQTTNYVLESHHVGMVNCSNCATLVMYPYGAPAIRCSSCSSITAIGDHNRRPPWSVQQVRAFSARLAQSGLPSNSVC